MVCAVRGAILVENNEAAIRQGVTRLVREITVRNDISEHDIVSVIFSQTEDLDALNPATALRSIGFHSVPLFCAQEPRVVGSPAGVVRVLITCVSERNRLDPVYLNGAERLRHDLFTDATQD